MINVAGILQNKTLTGAGPESGPVFPCTALGLWAQVTSSDQET